MSYARDEAPRVCASCGRALDPEAGPGSPRAATVPWGWADTRCHGRIHLECLRAARRSPCSDRAVGRAWEEQRSASRGLR